VSNLVMVGDKMKYNTLLVTLRQRPNAEDSFDDDLVARGLLISSTWQMPHHPTDLLIPARAFV